MVRCGFKNKHQKGMCSKEIKLCVQTILINLGSLVNMIWGGGGVLNDYLMSKKSSYIRFLHVLQRL